MRFDAHARPQLTLTAAAEAVVRRLTGGANILVLHTGLQFAAAGRAALLLVVGRGRVFGAQTGVVGCGHSHLTFT